jgi:hypothetical protein
VSNAASLRRPVSVPGEQEQADLPEGVVAEIVAEPEPEEAETGEAPPEAPPGPDDELWPSGPTLAMIDSWKEAHGPDCIYVSSLTPTYHVVWRTLTRAEYRHLVKKMEQAVGAGTLSQAEATMNHEEAMTELCLLFPKLNRMQMSGELAGLPSLISQQVLEASAFSALEVRQL